MIQGTKFKPKKSEIIDAIYNKKGVVQTIAKMFNVSHETMYVYLRKNDLMPLLEQVRNYKYEDLLDAAEGGLTMSVYEKDDKRLRLDACKFVLGAKGHARGWGVSAKEHDERVVVQDKISDNIKVVYKEME